MHELVLQWYEENKRDLPWRNTTPWGVMVSEFMLQQTPVNRVLPIWQEWILRWPTPGDLATAKRSEVITAWGRLGYPRRALRLHESAKIIKEEFSNGVPSEVEILRTLPGVGDYTAAAIAAFAFNKSVLVLDVNIRRLYARVIDGKAHPTTAPSQLERKLRSSLIPSDGATWAAATMEFGALICTSKSPSCNLCLLKNNCTWRNLGYPESGIARKSQSWDGTDRQCRGVILQALREKNKLSRITISSLWSDESQIERALKTLIADGLIETTGNSYRFPN